MENDFISSPPVALTIAGHDPSSGAGISADLQVFTAHGHFGVSAVTALTVQSTLGVTGVEPVSASTLTRVLRHLSGDLLPEGIKIGMLGTAENVRAVADFLSSLPSLDSGKPLIAKVLDPVLMSSSGAPLLDPAALSLLCESVLPEVDWITPNWVELAWLSGLPVTTRAEAEAAAELLGRRYPQLSIVVTGGDQPVPTELVRLAGDGGFHALVGEHIESRATHGTGCAFSSALVANLIWKKEPLEAVLRAKNYVAQAILRAPRIGQGRGPLNLLWPLMDKKLLP